MNFHPDPPTDHVLTAGLGALHSIPGEQIEHILLQILEITDADLLVFTQQQA